MRLLVTIAVFSLVGCSDVGSEHEALEPSPQKPIPGQDESTPIVHEDFAADLPGPWTEIEDADDESWTYRSANDSAQFVVSLLFTKPDISADEVRATVERLLQHRMKAESEIAPGSTLTDPVTTEQDQTIAARYMVRGPEPDRRASFMLLARPGKIGNFYLECSGKSKAEFEQFGRTVFNSIQF